VEERIFYLPRILSRLLPFIVVAAVKGGSGVCLEVFSVFPVFLVFSVDDITAGDLDEVLDLSFLTVLDCFGSLTGEVLAEGWD
jgi:hypothetical protein